MCIKSTVPILKKTQTQSYASSWSVQGLHTWSAVSFPVMGTPGIHPHGHALLSSFRTNYTTITFHIRFQNSYKKGRNAKKGRGCVSYMRKTCLQSVNEELFKQIRPQNELHPLILYYTSQAIPELKNYWILKMDNKCSQKKCCSQRLRLSPLP